MDNMNKNNNIDSNGFEKIDELYRKLGYFQRYGGTIIFVILISIIVIETFVFFQIINKEREIKKDWVNQRCKPHIMPIAGFINKPDGQTILEYTGDNFTYCIQEVTKTISGSVLYPFNHMTSMLGGVIAIVTEGIQAIRAMINELRNGSSYITRSIMDRIANVVIPLQVFIITFKDFTSKTNAVITDAFYLIGSVYYTLMSLANTLNDLFFQDIDIPEPNMCFDEDTIVNIKTITENSIQYKDIKISDIQVGDVLHDGSVVTAKLCLENPYDTMYRLNNITVSEKHRVFYENELIYVKDHPNIKVVTGYNKKYLYCINTTTKRIVIDDYVFTDWDDLTDKDIKAINDRKSDDKSSIHSHFDGGFTKETSINVFTKENRTSKKIEDINIGDILDLEKQNKVYAVVEVLLDDNDQLYEYRFYDRNTNSYNKVTGGNHMILRNGQKTDKLLRYKYENDGRNRKLRHLLTTNKSFFVNGVEFKDYDSCIENI